MNKKQTLITLLCLFFGFSANSYAEVGIIVNKNLYPAICTAIQTFIDDLEETEQKSVWLSATHFDDTNTIDDVKNAIISRYNQMINTDPLEGVIFIGDLPIAYYEVEVDFNNPSYGYKMFPFDLYFMDLDGHWEDHALDGSWGRTGFFDGHVDGNGDTQVEIWMSRITASVVSGVPCNSMNLGLDDEENIVNDYFARVHNRMRGSDSMPRKYLILGNDVSGAERGWSNTVSWANSDMMGYDSSNITTYLRSDEGADSNTNWTQGLIDGQEYAFITEHSSATHHATSRGSFRASDYIGMVCSDEGASNVRFYNLFACSTARYTTKNFLGGLYAYGHSGLVVMGSTKTGSMLSFDIYNYPLGQNQSFGEAFKEWLNSFVLTNTTSNKISWHYGMTLLGVGTLKLVPTEFVIHPSSLSPISGGTNHTVGLLSNGTVVAAGGNVKGQCNVDTWTDIIQVSSGMLHTVGLKSDGTVIAVGNNASGQCNVNNWTGIIQVSAGYSHTVGLKADGTVVAVGNDDYGQCDTSGFASVVDISAGRNHTVARTDAGFVIATGSNLLGQCNVSGWENIKQIAAGGGHTLGLQDDGTVVTAGLNNYGQCDTGSWANVLKISAGRNHSIAVTSANTVLSIGSNALGQCNTGTWTNIVQIDAGATHTLGIKADGSVVAVGAHNRGQCDVTSWVLEP